MSDTQRVPRVIILTGTELRHSFFRMLVARTGGLEMINSYCEGLEKSLRVIVEAQQENTLRMRHLEAREQSERDFFGLMVANVPDASRPVFIPKGSINSPEYVSAIVAAKPDLVIAYSSSIIREPLLTLLAGRLLNVHLGLSPYYRGSGTNFWPLVNREPEYVGVTFMHMDAGIDTGEIIHQMRARVFLGDGPAQIGNRLIVDMSAMYARIVNGFCDLPRMLQPPPPPEARFYRKKDFSEESVRTLYKNFSDGLVESYLRERADRCVRVPIVQNTALMDGST